MYGHGATLSMEDTHRYIFGGAAETSHSCVSPRLRPAQSGQKRVMVFAKTWRCQRDWGKGEIMKLEAEAIPCPFVNRHRIFHQLVRSTRALNFERRTTFC